jgi:hypothetical protein
VSSFFSNSSRIFIVNTLLSLGGILLFYTVPRVLTIFTDSTIITHMKQVVVLATLLSSSLFAAEPPAAVNPNEPIAISHVVSRDSIVAVANTSAEYTDGIMLQAIYSDGSADTKLVWRKRLQREPSVATFKFDSSKKRPLMVLGATLRSEYTGKSDVR